MNHHHKNKSKYISHCKAIVMSCYYIPFGCFVDHTLQGWMHHSEQHISVQSHTEEHWKPATWRYATLHKTISEITWNKRINLSKQIKRATYNGLTKSINELNPWKLHKGDACNFSSAEDLFNSEPKIDVEELKISIHPVFFIIIFWDFFSISYLADRLLTCLKLNSSCAILLDIQISPTVIWPPRAWTAFLSIYLAQNNLHKHRVMLMAQSANKIIIRITRNSLEYQK